MTGSPIFCPYCGHRHEKAIPSTGFNAHGYSFLRCATCKKKFRLQEGHGEDA